MKPALLQSIICLSLWALATLPKSWSVKAAEKDSFRQAYFMEHRHSYLAVEKIAELMAHDFQGCALACLRFHNCFSINMATQPSDASGHLYCELLSTNKYNASDNFTANPNFHHYSIETPCSRNPCENGGTCIPKYETGDSKCVCNDGYTGKYCEKEMDGLEKSAIIGQKPTYLQQLQTWLVPVKSSSDSTWRRCWHGNTDGFAASTFHSGCDNKGPTVTIVRVGSYIFGGYTDQPWGGSCVQIYSSKSFIFTLSNINGYRPQKLHLISSSKYPNVIYTCSTLGPTFGGGNDDLHIVDRANTNTGSHTTSGCYYQDPYGCSAGCTHCAVLAGSYNKWKVSDIEVFYETN